jgi:Flp pilus assembly protein TadD
MYAASGYWNRHLRSGCRSPVVEGRGVAGTCATRPALRPGRAFDPRRRSVSRGGEANPKDAGALANWGIALANIGRTGDAQQRLTESLAIDGKDALAHFSLGAVYDRQGDDARAAGEYEASLEAGSSATTGTHLSRRSQNAHDNPDQAATLYQGAVDASPSERSRMSLALAYVKARRYANARRDARGWHRDRERE